MSDEWYSPDRKPSDFVATVQAFIEDAPATDRSGDRAGEAEKATKTKPSVITGYRWQWSIAAFGVGLGQAVQDAT